MAEEPHGNPEEPDGEAPARPHRGRRLWERFSLSILAFLLLLLAQASFGILVRAYSRTFEIAAGPLVAFLLLATLAGFSAGMAVVLPGRLAVRHAGRGAVLSILPLFVTGLNVLGALVPGALPEGIALFTSTYLIGIQPIASLLLGVAVASAFAED